MKKKLSFILITTNILLLLGCYSSSAVQEYNTYDKIQIALVTKMVDSIYWQTIKKAAEEKAAELGNVEIIHLGPATESDIATQVSIMETCIVDEYDGIILSACDQDALIIPVEKAIATDIPVVMIDSGLSSPVYDAFLATDNIQAGAQCADVLAELIGGKGKIGIINFSASASNAIKRELGFKNQIEAKYPDIEIVEIKYCDSDPLQATTQATNMIVAEPELKGIWGVNAFATVGIANAVSSQNKIDEIFVVGFDNTEPVLAALESGTIQATAVQMPTIMASESVQMVINILNGDYPKQKEIDTGIVMVTLDNLYDELSQAALHQ
ncbi:MAG: hypothetical protein ATN31_06675 [Candidatus Epulonipiscioides saccharophilum]|nr:MAG: hypothetical protein ATN31_06675 [Epulopiscium sp. AS2M-Bin001]